MGRWSDEQMSAGEEVKEIMNAGKVHGQTNLWFKGLRESKMDLDS